MSTLTPFFNYINFEQNSEQISFSLKNIDHQHSTIDMNPERTFDQIDEIHQKSIEFE